MRCPLSAARKAITNDDSCSCANGAGTQLRCPCTQALCSQANALAVPLNRAHRPRLLSSSAAVSTRRAVHVHVDGRAA